MHATGSCPWQFGCSSLACPAGLLQAAIADKVLLPCSLPCSHEMPNLRGYVCDLFQTPGVAASVNLDHIKVGGRRGRVTDRRFALRAAGRCLSHVCIHCFFPQN